MMYITVPTLFIFTLIVTAMSAFIEEPIDQNVSVGQEAVFRCQHSSADTIRWKVNGSLISSSNRPDGARFDADDPVFILTITGRLDYNGTVVQCVARFDSGAPEQVSNPAALLIVEEFHTTSSSSTAPTTIPPVTPGVQEFTLSPTSRNVTLDTVAMFQCSHPTARTVDWIINGELFPQSSPGIALSTSGDTSTLSITALSEFNSTEILCEAFFRDAPSQVSDMAMMLIQGNLSNVTNLVRVTSTTISWEPPFSLDLTAVDPDIVYCVDVYNVTECGKRELLTSDCNVVVSIHTVLTDMGSGIYEYVVTPRSNATGSVNGTASLPLKSHSLRFTMNKPTLKPMSENRTDHITELSFNENDPPVPSKFTLLLEPVDGVDSGTNLTITADTTLNETRHILSLRVSQLHRARLWRCTILAFGCTDHEVEILNQPEAFLSTHDIQEVRVTSPQPGQVSVDGYFIEGSNALGVLVIATDGRNTSYHFIDRDYDQLNGDTSVSGLPGGECNVSVFVVMKNGLPIIIERAAAVHTNLVVANASTASPPSSMEYSVQSTSTGVCITCTFLESSTATDCVAVVHQRISQLNSSAGLMNIELSHKFTRSGDTASGCIEGVNLEDYQVGVVGVRQIKPGSTRSSNLAVILGGVVATVVLLLVIVIVLIVMGYMYYHKLHTYPGTGNVEKAQNHYTTRPSAPAPPTENPRAQLVVPSVERSVGMLYDVVPDIVLSSPSPLSTTSSCTSEASQASTVSTSVSESSSPSSPCSSGGLNQLPVVSSSNESAPPYSAVEPQPSFVASPLTTADSTSKEQNGNARIYTTVEVKPQSVSVPPFEDKGVVYADIIKAQAANEKLYAAVNPKKSPSTREDYRDDLTKVIYTEISPHGIEKPQAASVVKMQTAPPPTPFTVENVCAALLSVAPKWRAIGEAFPVSEKRLDDIETTERDEQCLQEMVEAYMLRRDLNHTWDEIVNALKKIQEDRLAENIHKVHVAPYVLTLPNEPQVSNSMQGPNPLRHVHVRKVSTDDGSLDTPSPALSGQLTEPATSECVACEGEMNVDKVKFMPTSVMVDATPIHPRGGAVLEMPSYSDDEHFTKSPLRNMGRKKRIAVDGDSTELESDNVEVTNGKCVSGDDDSGVSEDLPSPTIDGDIPTYASTGENKFSGVSHETTGQSHEPAGRTGAPTVQVTAPSQNSSCFHQKQLMEGTFATDLVRIQPPCAIEQVSHACQEREPHEDYWTALARQCGHQYPPKIPPHTHQHTCSYLLSSYEQIPCNRTSRAQFLFHQG